MSTNFDFTNQGNQLLRQIDELIDRVKSNQPVNKSRSDVKQISNNVDVVRKRFKKIVDSFLWKGIVTESIKPYTKKNLFGWTSIYRYPSILSMNTFVSELSSAKENKNEKNKVVAQKELANKITKNLKNKENANKREANLKVDTLKELTELKRKVQFGNNQASTRSNIKVEYNSVNTQFKPLVNQKLQPGNKNFINGKLPMDNVRYNRILSVIQNIKKKTN